MTLTIYEGYDDSYVMIGSKNREFVRRYGRAVRVLTQNLYREMKNLTNWVNNELGEECLFEID